MERQRDRVKMQEGNRGRAQVFRDTDIYIEDRETDNEDRENQRWKGRAL